MSLLGDHAKPDPTKPHAFRARRYGSRVACHWCGGHKEAAIHTTGRGIAEIVKKGPRGQALIEMALITPILLLMIVGALAVGWIMLDLNQLNHAAQEAAVAGAMNPGDSCGVATVTANAIYPDVLASTECEVSGQYITITVSHPLPLHRISPIWGEALTLTATAKAVLR